MDKIEGKEVRWIKYIRSDGTLLDFTGRYKIDKDGDYYKFVNKNNQGGQGIWHLSGKGYRFSTLVITRGGNKYTVQAHRAVKSTFEPEGYFEGAQVDHIDSNPANNSLSNLDWLSPKDNNQKASAIIGTVFKEGIRYDFDCMSEFCREHGINQSNLCKLSKEVSRYRSCKGFTLKKENSYH